MTASLVLLTLSFRSSALDGVQGAGVSALRPFEVAATRVAQPFRDAASWTNGLFRAKSENRRLKREVEELRREVAGLAAARRANAYLERLLRYERAPAFPEDYTAVAAQVLTSPTVFDQTVTIAAGSNRGIRVQDVVVTADGLVGQVTKVFGSVSRVMLITAADSAVRAVDERDQAAVGILQRGSSGDTLSLTRVGKDKRVSDGDTIVTAGSPGEGRLPSLFPANIPIGVVASVGQSETDIFKQIQVEPFVDLSSLQSVLVLVPKAKPRRAAR
ncbi:MAG TPA: rod shape-determining protein MreC [Gaiellaceae bacterium]|nr:rod shape-determining protein MreC [Gaiellaceae bacterium]